MSDTSMVASATLSVTVSENISIGGKNKGGTITKSIGGITRTFTQTFPLSNVTETVLYTTHSSVVSGSQFDDDLIKYVRITNKDTYYSCDIIIENGEGVDGDEVGMHLGPGESYIFWNHDTALDATAAGADVATTAAAVVGDTTLNVADGNAGHGTSNGQYLTLISTDQTKRTYILVDGANSTITTGTILTGTSDVGSGTLAATVPTYEDLPGQLVAVTFETGDSQNDLLKHLVKGINHVNGHGGKLTMGSVPVEADSSQSVTMAQTYAGAAGNTVTTENITNLTSPDFVNGVTAGLTAKNTIHQVSAIAREAKLDLEVFIASE